MSRAYCCGICEDTPAWRIDRGGDAVVSWACHDHLSGVCVDLQRPGERTKLSVRPYATCPRVVVDR